MVVGGHSARGIEANTVILPGIELGNDCIIGAGAIVTHSFSEKSIVVGVPGSILDKKDIKLST